MTDLVDCSRLAEDSAVLTRRYELSELPRIRDLLAEPGRTVQATYAFAKLASGRVGAEVTVRAIPALVCQRCMQGFDYELESGSAIEFTASDVPEDAGSARELFRVKEGLVSLRELAEEELLLALPIAPVCDTPLTCGKAPVMRGEAEDDAAHEMRRPFSTLQDLLKKT